MYRRMNISTKYCDIWLTIIIPLLRKNDNKNISFLLGFSENIEELVYFMFPWDWQIMYKDVLMSINRIQSTYKENLRAQTPHFFFLFADLIKNSLTYVNLVYIQKLSVDFKTKNKYTGFSIAIFSYLGKVVLS